MTSQEHDQWLNEFAQFSENSMPLPAELQQSIKSRLFPNPWKVFSKVMALHAVVGSFSLAICNQFGLNPFQTSQSLTDFFMRAAGHQVCTVACGVFFVMTTYLMANLFLTLEELETIRKYEWRQTALLSFISIFGFHLFGAELVAFFVGLWLVGALLGGWLTIEASYHFRSQSA